MTPEQKSMLFKVIGAIIALIGTFTVGNQYHESNPDVQTCVYMMQSMRDQGFDDIGEPSEEPLTYEKNGEVF